MALQWWKKPWFKTLQITTLSLWKAKAPQTFLQNLIHLSTTMFSLQWQLSLLKSVLGEARILVQVWLGSNHFLIFLDPTNQLQPLLLGSFISMIGAANGAICLMSQRRPASIPWRVVLVDSVKEVVILHLFLTSKKSPNTLIISCFRIPKRLWTCWGG